MNRELFKAMALDLARGLSAIADGGTGLLDYMVGLTPGFRRLSHFGELAATCERAVVQGSERFTSHAPPRHGKTELMLALVPWAWRRRPKMEFLYATYGDALSDSKSRRCQELARAAGFTITKESASEWRTAEGGVFRATSIGGPATGEGADMLLVDDFFKNRAEAESGARRKFVWDWLTDVGLQRLSPRGSAWVNAARWHVSDPSGQLQKMGWPYLRYPALQEAELEAYDAIKARLMSCTDPEEGARLRLELSEAKAALRPLWPDQWGADALLERRRLSEASWLSLQQGSPRPRGGKVFRDVYSYNPATFPARGLDAIGVDLAYTAKSSADWSVGAWGRRAGGRIFVRDAIRDQAEPRVFIPRLGMMQQAAGGAPARWYTSTTEKGTASLSSAHGFTMEALLAKEDKFGRAQAYAGAWNDGLVLLPADGSEWVDWFIEAHLDFTGVGDESDDPVDAAVAMYDLLVPEKVMGPGGDEELGWQRTVAETMGARRGGSMLGGRR